MVFADSHAHLALVAEELGIEELDRILAEYAAAWDAAAARGESGPLLVDPGVDSGDLRARRELLDGRGAASGGRPFLRMAAGVWPSAEALARPADALAALEASVAEAKALGSPVAAIGEGGLDYYHMNGERGAQIALFSGQIELAARLGLPLVVHSRDAFADTLAVLSGAKLSMPVVIHCFGYGPDEARAFLDLGCHLSFAGNLTYKKADALRAACALAPADRILLETDSPYLCPEPRRGRPCSPLDVERTYAAAAAIRGEAGGALAEAVSANLARLFG